MQHFGPFAVGIACFVFLAVAAVAGIVGDYKKRALALEPLRAAIERGQQLDPAVVERLMAPESRDERLNPLSLKVGGIVIIAAGIGVALLSVFLAQVAPVALYPVLGGGIVAVCVGTGLVVAARVAERHGNRQGTRGP
ncbi:MAG TPA: hypothetical protein VMO54_04000 [Steroidobacteraceae bacterium]|nr:hypothetical protein [Steroidobacteraceae bacterium]